jgi:ATP/maltotriose-dependent transcriptional regulator MalT
LDEAITVLREAVKVAKAIPSHTHHISAGAQLARCYLRQDELRKALSTLDAARQVYAEHGAVAGISTQLCNASAEAYLAAAEQGDEAEKAGWLRKAGRACRAALKQGRVYRPRLPEAMMLQGRYQWLNITLERSFNQKYYQHIVMHFSRSLQVVCGSYPDFN